MNKPILIPVDEIIHTYAHPSCGDATSPCNVPLRDANAEAVARMMASERGMSRQEARQTLRITARRLGDDDTATYDSETHSLQLVRAWSKIRIILTLDVCYRLHDLLKAMLPHRENEGARWQAEISAQRTKSLWQKSRSPSRLCVSLSTLPPRCSRLYSTS